MNAQNADDLPLHAEFNPLIKPYLVITIGFSIAMTIIGLPVALIWFLGVGQWWARHYFEKLECVLSENSLRYRKGIIFQVEKTIPLENIQDVTFIEGPILKRFHLATLKFELEEPILWRRNKELLMTVRAGVADGVQGPDVAARIDKALAPLRAELPPGYRIEIGGGGEAFFRPVRLDPASNHRLDNCKVQHHPSLPPRCVSGATRR